jgi:hypothetical protein
MHTLTHPYLERLSNAEVTAQVFEDKKNLEKLAGYPVTGLSYPFGTYDRNVAGLLRAMGVEYARTVHSTGEYRIPDDFLVWNPTCHHNKLCEHTEKFKSLEARVLAVLYCWGHTYEFDNQGNWSQIEEQFKSIAGQDDIWYATNIEICRYVKAGKSLVVSADGETAYNGSALSVWVEVDRKIYEIKSGGTVCFG